MNTIQNMTKSVTELGNGARQSVEELSRSAASVLDEAREHTGAALHSAASSLRSTATEGSQAIDNIAGGTADRLDATATFVEDHDLRSAVKGVRRFGLRHMTGFLVAAAAIGFVAGSVFGGATHCCGKRT
jgi:hypothetical protein